MDDVTDAFGKSLFNTAEDILPDLAEMGVDQFFADGILKEIPIVKALYAVAKVGYNVKERNLLKQTLYMIEALRNKVTNPKKIEKYQLHLRDNPQYAEKELGRVLIILDQTIDVEKSQILGVLYGAFVNEEISWEIFCELTEITRRMFLRDFAFMKRLAYGAPLEAGVKPAELISASRLVSVGVVIEGSQSFLKTIAEIERRTYSLSDIGRVYLALIEPWIGKRINPIPDVSSN